MTSAPEDAAPAWTSDRLLGGRLTLRQPARGYRVAIDTILLAAAVPARAGDLAVELGAGVGGASLALARRVDGVRIVALERDPVLVGALAENAAANGLDRAVHGVLADVAAPPLRPGRADLVFANPPYTAAAAGTAPRAGLGRRARREGEATLADWLAQARRLVRPGGDLVLVHRADRLGEIVNALAPQPLHLLPLWSRAGRPAKRVLVRARIGRRGGVRLLAGLVLHDAQGHFTGEAEAVLRDAAGLSWE